MTETHAKTPWHIWAVGTAAVLFNAIGAFDYVMSKMQGAAYMESAGMTAAQIAFMAEYPLWMNIVWPTGVWTAFIGSVLILMRRKAAFPLFAISLVAFLTSLFYSYVLTTGAEIMGPSINAVNAVITAELVALLWYARAQAHRGVLR